MKYLKRRGRGRRKKGRSEKKREKNLSSNERNGVYDSSSTNVTFILDDRVRCLTISQSATVVSKTNANSTGGSLVEGERREIEREREDYKTSYFTGRRSNSLAITKFV